MVTGTTDNSRLIELKKYAIGVPFEQQYPNVLTSDDGVDYVDSVSGVTMVYYIGGIKFIDDVTGGTTTFSVAAQGTGSTANFINTSYYKDPNESKIISNPKINDDVFIIREELSAFDKNYRLEYISKLVDLTTYAGGKFFNIINNT